MVKIPKEITTVIDQFDFIAVHKTMEHLEWNWCDEEGYDVPTVGELINKALELLLEVHYASTVHNSSKKISSGGLIAEWDKDTKEYTLTFAVSTASSYI